MARQEGTLIPVSTRKERSAFVPVDRVTGSSRESLRDRIAVEEPLEIRLNGKSVAVVMRSPGNDEELACGFLFTEGLLKGKGELESVDHRRDPRKSDFGNVVEVVSTDDSALAKRGWQRNFVSASSCGLCGKLTIESVRLQAPPIRNDDLKVSSAILYGLVDKMRAGQAGFDETGGIHAAGLFDRQGNLLILREDIGRHNAVDKVVGAMLLADSLPLSGKILVVSGRSSFEIVQKALMARVPFVAAVSAASSLAVDLAESSRMALVGFLRGNSMNVYCGAERIA
ncbi:MAG TPA: formate dehydrogenase accessory sulfurtransferase FdhD [Vicinamibacteria bacterium]|nr:formate dehydrogenase accessory sulfurtransferase FdhD [Vicinamibacteria bacterium]